MFNIEEHEAEWRKAHPEEFYSRAPKIIQWVIKNSNGLIKNEKQAKYALVVFSIVIIFFSIYLVWAGTESKLTPEEQLYLDTSPSQFNP